MRKKGGLGIKCQNEFHEDHQDTDFANYYVNREAYYAAVSDNSREGNTKVRNLFKRGKKKKTHCFTFLVIRSSRVVLAALET